MAEFKIIETQEQLDAVLKDRLARQEESITKKFDGFISPDEFKRQTEELNTKLTELGNSLEQEKAKGGEYEKTISSLNEKVKKYESDSVKTRIVAEMGLPLEVADRIKGETPDDMKKDAESLKALFGARSAAPLYTPERGADNSREAALKELAGKLTNKKE
jgi:chromatin remodeling complex protein RSC6